MICSIHQPNYIPYIGLFYKIKESDIFVFYDNAQYTKGDYHNRNTIKGANGAILLSIPVKIKLGQKINETNFDKSILLKHWKTIEQSYKKAKYFEEYKNDIYEIFSYQGNNLAEFNIFSIKKICNILNINVDFITLSEKIKNLDSKSTDALIDICKLVGASEYLSGIGGKNYIEKQKFKDAGIKLGFQEFYHPKYIQLRGDFIPYMSIIDFIFNNGNNLY